MNIQDMHRSSLAISSGGGTPITVKSLIIDITDGHATNYLNIRSVDFKLDGSVIALTDSDLTAYSGSNLSTAVLAKFAFITALSKTGAYTDVSWMTALDSTTDTYLVVVLDTAITPDAIEINNCHNSGTSVDLGAKTVKIYSSTDAIESHSFEGAITNSTLLFDGVLDQHSAANEADPQVIWTL